MWDEDRLKLNFKFPEPKKEGTQSKKAAAAEKASKIKWILIWLCVFFCCCLLLILAWVIGFLVAGGTFTGPYGLFSKSGLIGGKELQVCPEVKTKATNIPPVVKLDFGKAAVDESTTEAKVSVNNALDHDNLTCTHTMNNVLDPTPWWRVDMAVEHVIDNVVFLGQYRPGEVSWDNDLEVRVGNFHDEPGVHERLTTNGLCNEFIGVKEGKGAIPFKCPAMLRGRYLTIQKIHACLTCGSFVLSVCDLTIYGYVAPPLTKPPPTRR